MNRYLKLLKNIKNKFLSPNKLAKQKGIKFGEGCIFRTKNFGSEPYLITMGDNVATSANVTFITHDGAVHVLRKKYKELENIDSFGEIIIGNNVFIGMHTTILPNTKIGDNVIIGANSLVKGILDSDSVYAGVPAKKISTLDMYLKKNKHNFTNTFLYSPKEKKNYLLSKKNLNEKK